VSARLLAANSQIPAADHQKSDLDIWLEASS